MYSGFFAYLCKLHIVIPVKFISEIWMPQVTQTFCIYKRGIKCIGMVQKKHVKVPVNIVVKEISLG